MNEDKKQTETTDDEIQTFAARAAQKIENTIEILYDSLKTDYREKTEEDRIDS